MLQSEPSNVRFTGRKQLIGLGLLAILAGLAWFTMDPGRLRTLVVILLAAFALRLLLVHRSSASISEGDSS
jgi:hypothetical protein